MSRIEVWKPGNEKIKASEKKQTKKLMSDSFWDAHIQKGDAVIFRFLDGASLVAKILQRDLYHLKIEADDVEMLLFKHALKWAEEVKYDDEGFGR